MRTGMFLSGGHWCAACTGRSGSCVPDQARLTESGRAHEGFRAQMRSLLAEVKARGEPAPDDQSISGLLLRLRDPSTGALRMLR